MTTKKLQNMEDYISGFPEPIQSRLREMKDIIAKTAPAAVGSISYGVPVFILEGNLVHFGGYKNHIGFYPGSKGIEKFKKELSGYRCSKGTVQFPLDKPLPRALIKKIVQFRMQQNREKALAKKTSVTKKTAGKK